MAQFVFIPIIFFGLIILISAFFIVKQQTSVIVERFGKFQSIRHSGLQLKIPLVDRIAGRLSLKIQQLDVMIETKTLDDVFVKLKVSVQYRVIEEKVYEAFYKDFHPLAVNKEAGKLFQRLNYEKSGFSSGLKSTNRKIIEKIKTAFIN